MPTATTTLKQVAGIGKGGTVEAAGAADMDAWKWTGIRRPSTELHMSYGMATHQPKNKLTTGARIDDAATRTTWNL